jgi:hypothetical protein
LAGEDLRCRDRLIRETTVRKITHWLQYGQWDDGRWTKSRISDRSSTITSLTMLDSVGRPATGTDRSSGRGFHFSGRRTKFIYRPTTNLRQSSRTGLGDLLERETRSA